MELAISILSLVVAGVSALIGLWSLHISKQSADSAKGMFQRQGVIDLYVVWQDVRDIDHTNAIVPDIVRAAKALSLTASLWNHAIIEREILMQSYWDDFSKIYDKLDQWNDLIEGINTVGKQLLTCDIQTAHSEMKQCFLARTTQTSF